MVFCPRYTHLNVELTTHSRLDSILVDVICSCGDNCGGVYEVESLDTLEGDVLEDAVVGLNHVVRVVAQSRKIHAVSRCPQLDFGDVAAPCGLHVPN